MNINYVQFYKELSTLTEPFWTTNQRRKHTIKELDASVEENSSKITAIIQKFTTNIKKNPTNAPLLTPNLEQVIRSFTSIYSKSSGSSILFKLLHKYPFSNWKNASHEQQLNTVNLGHLAISEMGFSKDEEYEFIIKAGKKLKFLDLRNFNHFTDEQIDNILSQCTNLEELYIAGNELITNQALKNLPKLAKLRILHLNYLNNLNELPQDIGLLSNLEILNIKLYSLTSLPESIGKLQKLKKLTLSYNKIETLPESLCSLTELRILDLQGTDLKSLPEAIGELKNLTKLNLSQTKIKLLPLSIYDLVHLRKFYAPSQIAELSSECYKWTSLSYLSIESDNIKEIPFEIGKLIKLHTLRLNSTQITTLPPSIGNLQNLRVLDLSYCRKLESLPSTLRFLSPKLEIKVCYCISLTSLPSNIDHIDKIYKLGCNKID